MKAAANEWFFVLGSAKSMEAEIFAKSRQPKMWTGRPREGSEAAVDARYRVRSLFYGISCIPYIIASYWRHLVRQRKASSALFIFRQGKDGILHRRIERYYCVHVKFERNLVGKGIGFKVRA
jgi:hypothetical protein